MKRITLIIVMAMLAGTMGSFAADVFHIQSFHGVVTTPTGTFRVNGNDLSTNEVVLIVDQAGQNHAIPYVNLAEVDGTTTNSLIDSYNGVYVGKGRFYTDLEGFFTPANTNVPAMQGDIMAIGKLSPPPESGKAVKRVSIQLIGAWHDPQQNPTNAPPSTFKGTLTGKIVP